MWRWGKILRYKTAQTVFQCFVAVLGRRVTGCVEKTHFDYPHSLKLKVRFGANCSRKTKRFGIVVALTPVGLSCPVTPIICAVMS